jgi:SAM-dependent methyltransferase
VDEFHLENVERCIVCAAVDFEQILSVSPYGFQRCRRCRHVWLSPRIASEDLARFYATTYASTYQNNPEPLERQLANPTFKWRAKRLERFAGGRRFFELGCGDGNFLAVLRSRGWNVDGGEISAAGVEEAANRHGLRVSIMSHVDAPLPGHYDAIGLYHVLEHLYSPRNVLRTIRSALLKDGILHIQVPNRRSLDGRLGGAHWFGLQTPQHVHLFEPVQLARILREEGFEPLSVSTYDPWHGPGIVNATIVEAIGSVVRKRRFWSSAGRTAGESTVGDSKVGGDPSVYTKGAKKVVTILLQTGSAAIAHAQSSIGFGNVIDVIACATRPAVPLAVPRR